MSDAAVKSIEDMTEVPSPALSRPMRFIIRPLEMISAVLVFTVLAIILASVFFRYVLHSPLIYFDDLAALLFLWLVMYGAVIAIPRNEHLRLTIVLSLIPERYLGLTRAVGYVTMIVFLAVLIDPLLDHFHLEKSIVSAGLGISKGFRAAGLAIGMGLMLAVVLIKIVEEFPFRTIAAAVAIVAVSVGALWLLQPLFADLGRLNILVFFVGVQALCLAAGIPIAFCFGMSTLAFLAFTTRLPLSVVVGRMDEGMSSPILLSVPIFVMLGLILDSTGMGRAIVGFLSVLVGHVRAGMSYVLLGSLYIVSGISGSKISDMATVAPALFPEMRRRGAKPPEMVALLGTGAIMADTVPPSIVLIVLGSIAGLSVASLFVSGFVVAGFLALILAVIARWRARGESMEGVRRASMQVVGRALLIAIPVLLLPFLIRAAVTEGVATATEVSALAVVYSLVIGATLYGGISFSRVYAILVETAAASGAILLIMGAASAAAWCITQTGFASQLGMFMSNLPGGWVAFMLASIVIFMLLGCLLEGLPAIVLLGPLMFPIAYLLGIDGIHYAMVVIVAVNIGLFIPPIGIGFYLACNFGKVTPDKAMGALWAYLFALFVGLMLITFIPSISIGFL